MVNIILLSPQSTYFKSELNAHLSSFNFNIKYTKTLTEAIHEMLDCSYNFLMLDVDAYQNEIPQVILEVTSSTEHPPQFIALSKTKEFAYQAFKYDFYNYLIHPFIPTDLIRVSQKIKRAFSKQQKHKKICLQSHKDYQYLNTNDIIFLKADNNSTDIYLKDNRVVTAFKTLKVFEENLPHNFRRIHRSYIVNKNFISRINFGKNRCSLSNTIVKVPFSKSFRASIEDINKQLSGFALSAAN